MDVFRRILLRGAGATGALAAALAAGVLKPTRVIAADWNKAAFESRDLAGAIRGIGVATPVESKDIVIKAPDVAENGAVVPIEITSNVPNTQTIWVLVEKNPMPLAGEFNFANGALAHISVRLKMGQTSSVSILAKADGKFYSASREVKVTVGGCG
jgi:sulfur-oxidizing protein SoxY